jgi:hypothetical protein
MKVMGDLHFVRAFEGKKNEGHPRPSFPLGGHGWGAGVPMDM